MQRKIKIREGTLEDSRRWALLYKNSLGRHEDWTGKRFVVAVNEDDGMPVVACFLIESFSKNSAEIDYIESHRHRAGLDVVRYLQGQYAILKSEAVSDKGEKLLKDAEFKYSELTELGPLYIWRRPKNVKRESFGEGLQRETSGTEPFVSV